MHKDIIIIGAGQCGLAAGRYLQKEKADFLILEKNKQVGDNWRKRYDSLKLFTPASLNALPDLPMAIAPTSRPNKNQIADYFNRYAEHFDLPIQVNEEVFVLNKVQGLFQIQTSRTSYTAEKVIIAAGFCERPNLPPWATDLSIPYIHSNQYKNPISIKGKQILLVGTGNSAAQIGAELTKHFEVDWSMNKKPKFASLHLFGKNIISLGKAFGYLDKAASEKTIHRGEAIYIFDELKQQLKKLKKRKQVIQAEGSQITFEGGESKNYDFIVFATGFVPNFDFIAIPEFEGDLNQLRKQQGLSTVSGLHFIGIPYQRSRSSQLIYGSQKDAAYIVSQLRVTQDQVMG
ncbi:MAG TPA: NAD(P)/FAD-dependent oxidoreductase [Cyclobacteriaceae bacterium]|nr:NAD(P)/FAD-dependent oxidoreductase [Cyclobacteriaceae bacterium]